MFNFRPYIPWLSFYPEPTEGDLPGFHFNPETLPGVQAHTFSLATPADTSGAHSQVPANGDVGGAVGLRVGGGDPFDPFKEEGVASTGPNGGLNTPNLTSPLFPWTAEPPSSLSPQVFGRRLQSDTFVPGFLVKLPDDLPGFHVRPPDDPPGFRMAKSALRSNALAEEGGLQSFGYAPVTGTVPPPGFPTGEATLQSDSHVYSAIPPLYDPFLSEPPTNRIKQALDEIARIYGLDRNQATLPNIVGGPILRLKPREFSQPIESYRRRLREVEGKPPITDQSSRQSPLNENVVTSYAPMSSGYSIGREPHNSVELVVPRYAHGPRPNDAISPPNTDIRGSVVASLATRGYQTYGTNSALATPFGHTGQRFGAEPSSTYYRRNDSLSLADLSGRDAEGNKSTQPSISDAYPEPLVSGAQYAQVVVQWNGAVLGNPRIDRTTERLLSILAETVQSLGPGAGPIFGIQAHVEFAKRVKELNIPGIRQEGVEQSFSVGEAVRYGLAGSVRTDIVLRDRDGNPIAVYDLKTGNAKLTPSRVQEIRDTLGLPNIPVIELRYRDEQAISR